MRGIAGSLTDSHNTQLSASQDTIEFIDEEQNVIEYQVSTEEQPTSPLFDKKGRLRPEHRNTFLGWYLSVPHILSVIGSTRSGKGVFGSALAEKFLECYPKAEVNWILLPHMAESFSQHLPARMHVYSDFLEALPPEEEVNHSDYEPKPTLFIFDEASRQFSQYDYRKLIGRILGNFCALHGHYCAWVVFLDQSRGYVKEARVREHAWGFLAMNSEELLGIMKRSEGLLKGILSHPQVRQFFVNNAVSNRTTLQLPQNGYGQIFIANNEYRLWASLKYDRPAWYTKRASEAGAKISRSKLIEMGLSDYRQSQILIEYKRRVKPSPIHEEIMNALEELTHGDYTQKLPSVDRVLGKVYANTGNLYDSPSLVQDAKRMWLARKYKKESLVLPPLKPLSISLSKTTELQHQFAEIIRAQKLFTVVEDWHDFDENTAICDSGILWLGWPLVKTIVTEHLQLNFSLASTPQGLGRQIRELLRTLMVGSVKRTTQRIPAWGFNMEKLGLDM